MTETVIRVENLGKKYNISHKSSEGYATLRDVIAVKAKSITRKFISPFKKDNINPTIEEFWALKDVSFDVKRGEIVGIIGRNGAGKSTLLKILSRITEPTTGRFSIKGRVACLLEVGTGFHPELTGRENIFLNGAILGMTRQEIKRKFDEIVNFAEIDKFLDTPVKRYSSGMYVRLAFSVAAHLEPEILIIDEVLAVGDVTFQKKCLGKMGDVSKEGRTILFVSHNMVAVENLCMRAFLIDNGSVLLDNNPSTTIENYLNTFLPTIIEDTPLINRKDRSGSGIMRLTSFHLENTQGNKLLSVRSGMDIIFVFGYQSQSPEDCKDVDIGFSIHDKETLTVLYSSYMGQTFHTVPPKGEFRCTIPKLPFSKGRYRVGARITVNNQEADWPRNYVGYLNIESGNFYGTGKEGFGASAPILLSGAWAINEKAL